MMPEFWCSIGYYELDTQVPVPLRHTTVGLVPVGSVLDVFLFKTIKFVLPSALEKSSIATFFGKGKSKHQLRSDPDPTRSKSPEFDQVRIHNKLSLLKLSNLFTQMLRKTCVQCSLRKNLFFCQVGEIFKVPSAWRSVMVDGYVDPSGGNRQVPPFLPTFYSSHPLPVLWNRNYFLRFRFRLLKSYGSGSGSDF
jgi:hypothetical protein